MCDYSLQMIKSRPAVVGDKLEVRNFGTGTTGFCSPDDQTTAVCVLPGTELAFDEPFKTTSGIWYTTKVYSTVAIFRQIHKDQPCTHHDALETPQGETVMLTYLADGQKATVLQLPAAPKTEKEAEDQTRLAIVG